VLGRSHRCSSHVAKQIEHFPESLGGPTMLARIGIMRALNRHDERVFNPDRKDPHWGRRPLARDP
jgi:hypothetical protein